MGFKLFGFLKKDDVGRYNKRTAKLYKQVFLGTPEGEEVLADLVATGFILESTEGDPMKEGSRKVILRILGILDYDTRSFRALTAKMKDGSNTETED